MANASAVRLFTRLSVTAPSMINDFPTIKLAEAENTYDLLPFNHGESNQPLACHAETPDMLAMKPSQPSSLPR